MWVHVAATRAAGTTRVFINGTLYNTTTAQSSCPIVSNIATIGAYNDGTTTQNYSNGYIDDLRITKGLARYVDSFAPPIAQFPDL